MLRAVNGYVWIKSGYGYVVSQSEKRAEGLAEPETMVEKVFERKLQPSKRFSDNRLCNSV